MITFLERFSAHVKAAPDQTAVVDQNGKRLTSYLQLDEMSGRIAAWLKKQGIGREDVVAICVPRGVEFIAVRLAVMKLGAVWVGTEALMGAERIAYVIKDSGARVEMNEENLAEALKEEPLSVGEWADPDPHDLAFLYYTSGSTGKPKGVAQEYGVYPLIMASMHRVSAEWVPFVYANVIPETYVVGIYLTIGVLQAGCVLDIVPLPLLRDPAGLLTHFREQKVTAACILPTLVKALENAGGLELEVLHVSGEVVSELFIPRFTVMNVYGPTEVAYVPFAFTIDKAWPITPIGTADQDSRAVLLNENGEEDPREGMLCIRTPYFRGYLHDEEKSGIIMIDGEPYFQTGDYASVDENGNYTILGRADDMVKINGNRIEPAEAEAALKKVLHADFAAVKVWERNGSRYLCGYHTTGQTLNAAEMAKKLNTLLPPYMIPSCYVSLEKIPLNANGKVDKQTLPEPSDELLFAPYAPAENELQEKLLGLMAGILGIETGKPGIDDDFFLLGGDSIGVIKLITQAGEKGLTAPLIYRERTIRNICRALIEGGGIQEAERKDAEAPDVDKVYALTEEQQYFLETELRLSGQRIWHLPLILSFSPDIEEKKLEQAVLNAFAAHPSLLFVLRKTQEGFGQQYCPQNNTALSREEISEEELEEVQNRFFAAPFAFDGTPLFHRRLFRTPERLTLLLDIHHIVCDGVSQRVLTEDILSLLQGESLIPDPFFELLKRRLAYPGSSAWKKDMEYYDNLCRGGEKYDTFPRPDSSVRKEEKGTLTLSFSFSQNMAQEAFKRLHLSSAGFYMLAAALAIAAYNDTENVMLSWVYQGRQDSGTLRSVGLLYREYPAIFRFRKEDTIGKASAAFSTQLRETMLHADLSYAIIKDVKEVCFIPQGKLLEIPEEGSLQDARIPEIPGEAVDDTLDMEVFEGEDQFGVEFFYDAGLYRKESMERFAGMFERICLSLTEQESGERRIGEILEVARS